MTKSIYKSQYGEEQIIALYDKVLAQWPVPNEHLVIPTRYGDTFIIASGDSAARPLVLLHGTGSNSATWASDVIEYSKHFRIYAVDIPGEPGHSSNERFSWTGAAFTEWLDDVLSRLPGEAFILGGMSLGAWAALRYAIDKPERVSQLVVICPAGLCPPRTSFALRAVTYALLGEWGRKRMKRLIFGGIALPDDADRFFSLVARHFNFRLGSPPLFTDAELREISIPVVYVAGENDVLLDTGKSVKRLGELVPHLVVHILKKGHAVVNTARLIIPHIMNPKTPTQ